MKDKKLKTIACITALFVLFALTGPLLVKRVGNFVQQIQIQPRNATPDLPVKNLPDEYAPPSPVELIPADELVAADLILLGARQEVKNKTRYDAAYAAMSYPGGDVPADRGACTDVVIRAFRHAGIDLQQLIHEDMNKNFSLYPQKWGLDSPDPNIDHRRVPNQACFFAQYGLALTLAVEENLEEWQWGDVVYWRFPNGRDHCGIVSDRTTRKGLPLVIHNAGLSKEEDCLLRWEITGHFRYPADAGD
jgi:uncharacterized protein YijF (DUF1287 family)